MTRHVEARQRRRARQLLADMPLPPDQRAAKLERAFDIEYWRRLCPGLTVHAESVPSDSRLAEEHREPSAIAQRLARAGYFEAGRVLPDVLAGRMRDAVETIRAAGWPPVFCFVYDEFWSVWAAPILRHVLTSALGDEYAMIPHPWCWYVPPVEEGAGWAPHIDGWNRPKRISVWVALSDATLDNGCIYVVPRDRVVDVPINRMVSGRSSFRWRTWSPLMHACRALPTAAGSAIGWDFQVVHWGSMCRQAAAPRISVAAYFMPRDMPRRREERRLIDPASMPAFRDRLWTIGFSIRYFEHNDVRNLRYTELAAAIVQRAKRECD